MDRRTLINYVTIVSTDPMSNLKALAMTATAVIFTSSLLLLLSSSPAAVEAEQQQQLPRGAHPELANYYK